MLKKTVWAGALALLLTPAVVYAQSCDISDLPCARDGKKCNIKFTNLSGISENMCRGKSFSSAATVNVSAKDDNGKDLGNRLSIDADSSGSLNLSKRKKKNTSKISVGGTSTGGVSLDCKAIRQVLSGTGKCKIYRQDASTSDELFYYPVVLDCDQGNICETSEGK